MTTTSSNIITPVSGIPAASTQSTPTVVSLAANTSTSTVFPVQHIAIKPPIFSATNPNAFFHIFEAQFHLARVTSEETRFFHVLSSLPPDVVNMIPISVLNNHNYTELKTVITATHEANKPEMF